MIKFYEVECGKKTETGFIDTGYSIAIKADHYPTIKEAEQFIREDLKKLDFDSVCGVSLITEKEVHAFFNDSNIDDWPVLTKTQDHMRYTEALGKLFEIMQGRPDITEIKFDRENDTFSVISGSTEHICFGDEFRGKEAEKKQKKLEEKKFSVKLPNGYLVVEAKGAENEYPGVYVSFSEDGKMYDRDNIVACVEYDTGSREIKTETYRNGQDDPTNIICWEDGRDLM